MRTLWIAAVIVLGLAAPALAGDGRPMEAVTFSAPGSHAAAQGCRLGYFDLCSGWVSWWTGFNGTDWAALVESQLPPPRAGVCFDLGGCDDGCADCKSLDGVLWAWKRFSTYGRIDVEVYCADQSGCPVGQALGGFYDYHLDPSSAFQYFSFDGLDLPTESCKFAVIATMKTPGACAPYSDMNDANRYYECEGAWRCSGHSYIYRSAADYCSTGHPAALVVEREGACPGIGGFHAEFIVYAYLGCGPSVSTEKTSWSGVKKLFR
jgi:hypothetical protein